MRYIKYLTITMFAFIFTGCMQLDIPVNYDKTYAQGELKNVSKITEVVVVNDIPNKKIENIQTWRGGMLDVVATTNTDFSKQVARDFLAQYFTKVEIANKSGYFNFKINLKEMKTIALNNAPSFEIAFDVIVTKDKNIILKKAIKRLQKHQ